MEVTLHNDVINLDRNKLGRGNYEFEIISGRSSFINRSLYFL